MNTSSTRRGLLKLATGAAAYGTGATLISAAGVITTATMTGDAKAAIVDRTAWDRAFADYECARAAYEADNIVWERVNASREANQPIEPTEACPREFAGYSLGEAMLRLDRRDLDATRGSLWWGTDVAYQRKLADIEAIRTYRRERAENDRRHDWDAVHDRNDALHEAMCCAEDALIKMPAPHAKALAWKLNKLLADGGEGWTDSWSNFYVAQALADVRRLAAMEG